jgi:uncharacterized protein (TIGR02996 family)
MTREDDFQAALDANPTDWQTRLVFADWLEERGDPRAEGYRALGLWRREPVPTDVTPGERQRRWGFPGFVSPGYAASDNEPDNEHALQRATLPDDWHSAIAHWKGEGIPDGGLLLHWRCRKSRREVEDAAARAFTQLSAPRRTELLTAHPA